MPVGSTNPFKKDFPIFTQRPGLVYLDSAATSQKPNVVINSVTSFYKTKNANIHRGIYSLAEEATGMYESAREKVRAFINAPKATEVIFTQNTNESINYVSVGWAQKFLKKGDIIVLSEMEHHANIIPWLRLQKNTGVSIFYLPVTSEGRLDYVKIKQLPAKKIRLVALTAVSNVLGTINPLTDIIPYVLSYSPDAKILIDGAQAVAHMPQDVQALNIDFLAFSSHKLFGPSGVGVLWAKEELLMQMDPYLVGSNMIKKVTKDSVSFADLPDKFEAGTPNLEGVVGLGSAIDYISGIGFKKIQEHETELTGFTVESLCALPFLTLFGPQTPDARLGIFSFSIKNVHPHDVAQILDRDKICVRSGHHCCQILMQTLGVPATTRASVSLYNSRSDIDTLVSGLKKVRSVFSRT